MTIAETEGTTPTWACLVTIEPRLRQVESMAQNFHREGRRDWPAWCEIKAALQKLVGFSAECDALRSCLAYETAYSRLLAVWNGR